MRMILVTRAQMEACSLALPRRQYWCRACQEPYTHDQARDHLMNQCPKRKLPVPRV